MTAGRRRQCGAGERAGVVGCEIGVGIDDATLSARARGPTRRSGDARSRSRCPSRSSRPRDGRCRRIGAPSGRRRGARSAAAVQHRQRDAGALAHSSPSGLRAPPPAAMPSRHSRALVEPVAAEADVGRILPDDSIQSPGRIMFRRRISNGSIASSRARSSIADSIAKVDSTSRQPRKPPPGTMLV